MQVNKKKKKKVKTADQIKLYDVIFPFTKKKKSQNKYTCCVPPSFAFHVKPDYTKPNVQRNLYSWTLHSAFPSNARNRNKQ